MSLFVNWHGKPYYSLDAYCKNTYGEKLYKIALDAGMTCPNRDGTLGTSGCIFCSAGGSGDFAVKDLTRLAESGRALFSGKNTGQRYIGYFQAYTNTYAPVPYLEEVYTAVLDNPVIAGISIATRPDCLSDEILLLLSSLQQKYEAKFLWIELGLQTIHDQTAAYIRRGYPLSVFEQAVRSLKLLRIPVITHVILGLPGETDSAILETIQYLNSLSIDGIKLQLLHVLSGTDLAADYEQGCFQTLSLPEYVTLLTSCISHLSPNIVIHRLTGDGPKELLIAPKWSLNKRNVLNTIHKEMKEKKIWQGEFYESGTNDSL